MLTRIMKETPYEWIGEIPEGWMIKPVKQEFIRKKGKSFAEKTNILTLARSGVKIRDISTGKGQIASDYSNYNPVEPGDLLLNPMDLSSGDNCNISYVEGVISPAYFNLRSKGRANPYFYNYFFKLQYWLGSFFSHGKGVSFENRWTLNDTTLQNFPLVCPPYNEQERIVKKLNEKTESINKIINNTKNSIGELKKYKIAIITEALSKGLNPNVEMQSSKHPFFKEIPQSWGVSKIGRMYEIVLGKMLTNTKNHPEATLETYYSAANIKFTGISKSPVKKMWFSPDEKKNLLVNNGDLLIVEGGGGAGNTALVEELDEDIFVQNSVLIVRTKGIMSNKYLYYTLFSLMNNGYMTYLGNIATFSHYTKEKVSNTPVTIPSEVEQEDIVSYLDENTKKIDELITNKEKVIKELEQYKKSLIYEYITGKKQI